MANVVGQVGHLCFTSCMPLNTYGIQQQHHVKQHKSRADTLRNELDVVQRQTDTKNKDGTNWVKLPASNVVTVLTTRLHCWHQTGMDAVCSDWYGIGLGPAGI